MLPGLASSLSVLVLALQLCRIASKKGEYFKYYNKSSFKWSGSAGKCTLSAEYGSAGNSESALSSYNGCFHEWREWESQQEFDLEYWELLHVCSYLERVPESYRGVADYSSDNSLPEELVWSTACSKNSLNYCPRWRCDNSSSLWDPKYNKSLSYHMTTTLSFDSNPLSSTCYQCDCRDMTYAKDSGPQYAWYCPNTDLTYYPDVGTPGVRWTWTPITHPFRFRYRQCEEVTEDPTPQPSKSPNVIPTPQPTMWPTDAPLCSNNDGTINSYSHGSYFWDWETPNDCGSDSLQLCYCQFDGETHCAKTWEAMMKDPLLYVGFLGKCSYYLADCWRYNDDSLSRLFSWLDYDTMANPTCNLYSDSAVCPRCGCTPDFQTQTALTNHSYKTNTFDKIQNTTIGRADYVYEYDCTTCNCTFVPHSTINAPRGPLSYVDPATCIDYDTQNNNDVDSDEDCIDERLKCYSHSGPYEPHQGTETCSGQRESMTQFENACSFEQFRLDDSSPGDVCVEDHTETIGTWGCADSFECELYGGDGCYKASFDYQVTQYDCINGKWLGDTFKADLRYSCCSEPYCNNRTLEAYEEEEDEGCTKSPELEEYHQYKQECAYSQRNLYQLTSDESFVRAAFCGDDLDYSDYVTDGEEDEESLCTMLKVYWQYNQFCACNEARLLIQATAEAGVKDADVIRKYTRQNFWSSTSRQTMRAELKVMYEYWNCGVDEDPDAQSFFRCDFDAEVEAIKNEDVTSRDAAYSNRTPWWSVLYIFGIMYLFGAHDRQSVLVWVALYGCMMMYACSAAGDFAWSRNGGSYGDCEFKGSISSANSYLCEEVVYTQYEHEGEGLTWSQLVEACPELEQAGCYTEDQHLKMSELVWPSPTYQCSQCPRCPCSNETDTSRHFVQEKYDLDSLTNFIYRQCYECSCYAWDRADDAYAWDCSSGNVQRKPYAINDTDFCPKTPRPTPPPTEPLNLKCVEGNEGSLSPRTRTMYGEYGYSHCAWSNLTIERYGEEDPSICYNDQITPAPTTYWISSNNYPICQAISGDKTGCYYADYDLKLQTFDCAEGEWVSDKYRVDATLFCCNDGDYCNNQTVVHGSGSPNPSVEYYSYDNETVSVTCKRSGRLKEFMNTQYECPMKDHGFGKEYTYARKCKSGITDKKPGCDELRKYWKWATKCQCAEAQFFLKYVNSTYDEILNENFDTTWKTTRESLEEWNETLGCDWSPGSRWYCSEGTRGAGGNGRVMLMVVASYVFAAVAAAAT